MASLPDSKLCSKCKQKYPLTEYGKHSNGKYGLRAICKFCEAIRIKEWRRKNPDSAKRQRATRLQKVYSLSIEEYNLMLKEQNHKCYICNLDSTECLHGRLYVDHDHISGKVRGLLCHHCNSGLGYFKDNIELLQTAILYLREYSQ